MAARWKQQYFNAKTGLWGLMHSGLSLAIYERLKALDVETATPAEVAAIIGNRGWIEESCDLCDTYDAPIMRVGEAPDYEARWLWLCETCAKKIVAAFNSPDTGPR